MHVDFSFNRKGNRKDSDLVKAPSEEILFLLTREKSMTIYMPQRIEEGGSREVDTESECRKK